MDGSVDHFVLNFQDSNSTLKFEKTLIFLGNVSTYAPCRKKKFHFMSGVKWSFKKNPVTICKRIFGPFFLLTRNKTITTCNWNSMLILQGKNKQENPPGSYGPPNSFRKWFRKRRGGKFKNISFPGFGLINFIFWIWKVMPSNFC